MRLTTLLEQTSIYNMYIEVLKCTYYLTDDENFNLRHTSNLPLVDFNDTVIYFINIGYQNIGKISYQCTSTSYIISDELVSLYIISCFLIALSVLVLCSRDISICCNAVLLL